MKAPKEIVVLFDTLSQAPEIAWSVHKTWHAAEEFQTEMNEDLNGKDSKRFLGPFVYCLKEKL